MKYYLDLFYFLLLLFSILAIVGGLIWLLIGSIIIFRPGSLFVIALICVAIYFYKS